MELRYNTSTIIVIVSINIIIIIIVGIAAAVVITPSTCVTTVVDVVLGWQRKLSRKSHREKSKATAKIVNVIKKMFKDTTFVGKQGEMTREGAERE